MNIQPQPTRFELPAYLDSSMISTFRACPKKFYWSYVQKIAPIGTSIHLVAGGAFAAGIDAIRKAQFSPANRETPMSIDDMLAVAIKPFILAWGNTVAPEDSPKNFHNTFAALELYVTEHHPFHDTIQPEFKANGEPTSEFSFAIPLAINHPSGEPFLFVGRFDLLGLYHDRPVICDEKTTGSLGSYWTQQWDLRGQFMGYCWACQKLGIPIDTAIIRGIGMLKTETKFLTAMATYGKHLIDRWEIELYHTIELMMHYFAKDHYPYNFADACSAYGGCAFKPLCSTADPDAWLSNYESKTWSPIELD